MPKMTLQNTEFSFSILPLKLLSNRDYARLEISLRNEFITYSDVNTSVLREDLEKFIFSMFRFLAGAYGREYSLSFERAGIAVDMYPYTENNQETTRQQRRDNDCVMAIRLLLRSSDKRNFLGGVHTLLLHRDEIKEFATALRAEYDAIYAQRVPARGKYLYVGVSPLGYTGCNYWYLDPTKTVKASDYVRVRMGRHNTEQFVYVDSVRYFSNDTAPYDPETVKRVLRKATVEETEQLKKGE